MCPILKILAVPAVLAATLSFAAGLEGPPAAKTAAHGYDGGLTCVVNVKDLAKSIAWYRDVLGFEVLYSMPEMGFAELASPVKGVNVGLGTNRPGTTPGGSGGATLVWGTVDIEKTRGELEKRGVKFAGPTDVMEGFVKLASFADPDGNALMLYQDLKPKK